MFEIHADMNGTTCCSSLHATILHVPVGAIACVTETYRDSLMENYTGETILRFGLSFQSGDENIPFKAYSQTLYNRRARDSVRDAVIVTETCLSRRRDRRSVH